MWYALRAELAYFRPWLLGGFGIAAGVSVLLTVLVTVFSDIEGVPGFLPGMFPIIAGMVVAFIAQAYRVEERRARLLMAAPLNPRQMAGVMVLLPPCLVGIGVLASVIMVGLISLVFGRLGQSDLSTLVGFGGQFLAYAQLGPLAQEATAARRQQRLRASALGWAIFAVSIPFLAAFFWVRTTVTISGHLWQLIAVLIVMATSVALYVRRTDFTR